MPRHDTSSSPGSDAPGSRWSWLLPAGTFLAGCALGAVVTGVGNVGGADEPPTREASVAADDGSDEGAATDEDGTSDEQSGESGESGDAGEGDVTVRVPASCLQTADDATALIDSVDEVVAAVADFDPARLRQTVDDVQQVRDEVRDEAQQCREAAQGRVQGGASGTEDDGAAPATPDS